jgi:hypothetical protein
MTASRVMVALLCDDIRSEVRGKVSLMGLFDNFTVSDLNKPLPSFRIYARLGVEKPGEHAVRLQIISEAKDFRFELPGKLSARDPSAASGLCEAPLTLGIRGLQVPRVGRYQIRFVVDGLELEGPWFSVSARERRDVQ